MRTLALFVVGVLGFLGNSEAQDVRWDRRAEKDVSYPGAKRFNHRAWVKPALKKAKLKKVIENAAWSYYRRKRADAVIVFFFQEGRDESTAGAYTVARVTIAPNGRWEDAGKRGTAKAVTDINESYFKDPEKTHSKGTRVFLVNDRGRGTIAVCKTTDMVLETARRLPHGTPATINGTQRFVLGNYTIVTYEVKTSDGKLGWVGKESVALSLEKEKKKLVAANPAKAVKVDEFICSSKLAGDQLKVKLKTDLPEAMKISLSVSRSYSVRGKTSTYSLAYYSKHVTVKELAKGISVSVVDSVFNRKLQERKDLMRKIGEPMSVAKVAEVIEVSAFLGGSSIGNANENLIGKAVVELLGGRRVLESEHEVKKRLDP